MGYKAICNVSIFRSISELHHNILNNCRVIYGVILKRGITFDTSRQCLPDVTYFQILHRNYQWLLKKSVLYTFYSYTHSKYLNCNRSSLLQAEYKVRSHKSETVLNQLCSSCSPQANFDPRIFI